MKYTYRHSALEQPKIITLGDHGIEIEMDKKETQTIPYDQIVEVNPKFVGSKNYPNMYQTVIKPKQGKELTIRNHDYKGILNMEDISKMYTPFIAKLHQVVAEKNPSVIFKKGYKPGAYWASLLVFWTILGVIGIMTIGIAIAGMWMYAVATLFGFWVLFTQMRKFKNSNKPTIYTVDNIPPHLLPNL